MAGKIYQNIIAKKQQGKKSFAILIDPDKSDSKQLLEIITSANAALADYFFVGGSLLTNNNLDSCIEQISENSDIPIVLFPGNTMQISTKADAILFLSLISGRNSEMLIGRHVISAPLLKSTSLEVIPTGYMLIESGRATSVSYMSGTTPIPADKNDIAVCTAMAGEMLGLRLIFMDAGSGAQEPVSSGMIEAVAQNVNVPLIVGGGIKTPAKMIENCKKGADIIVVGNSIERNKDLVQQLAEAVHSV